MKKDRISSILNRHLPPVICFLGMMGCGKTTIGRHFAKTFGRKFIDLDNEVANKFNLSISLIFKQFGEQAFRDAEQETLNAIIHETQGQNLIISLGGGAFIQENIRNILQSHLTIYLKTSPQILLSRIENSKKRPLLNNLTKEEKLDKLKELIAQREAFYSKAKITVEMNTHLHKNEITEIILSKLLKPNAH
jgi:shikimate kinase